MNYHGSPFYLAGDKAVGVGRHICVAVVRENARQVAHMPGMILRVFYICLVPLGRYFKLDIRAFQMHSGACECLGFAYCALVDMNCERLVSCRHTGEFYFDHCSVEPGIKSRRAGHIRNAAVSLYICLKIVIIRQRVGSFVKHFVSSCGYICSEKKRYLI